MDALEQVIVGVLVAVSAAYVLWTLLPAGPRRGLARRLGPLLPAALVRVLAARRARRPAGCHDCSIKH